MSIYFIQQGNDGPIKIGVATNIDSRLSQLKTSSPYPLRLLGVTKGHYPEEKRLHAFFNAYRLNGEWFEPSQEILQFVKEYDNCEYSLSPFEAGYGPQLGFDDLISKSPPVLPVDIITPLTTIKSKKPAKNHRVFENRICRMCSQEFTPKLWNTVFCSMECRQEYKAQLVKPKISKICKYCKGEFITQNSRTSSIYCSQACRQAARFKSFICQVCENQFTAISFNKYCSEECRMIGSLSTCRFCGNEFHRTSPSHKFCSDVCLDLYKISDGARGLIGKYNDPDLIRKIISSMENLITENDKDSHPGPE